MMHVLVIGGTRFVGYLLTWRLLAAGHRVTLFNRGSLRDPFGDRVRRIQGDRRHGLPAETFDAAVDFAAYHASDVKQALELRVGHYVFVSSGQVYLVRDSCPMPATERDYDGPLLDRPADPLDHAEWEYGIHKRQCEDVLATAKLPSTRVRIPMVNGSRDHYRRIESYLWRILDGGPVLLPNGGGHIARHVYGASVAEAIAGLLGNPKTFGQAYNFSQDEEPTLAELVSLLFEMLGTPRRILSIPVTVLDKERILPVAISPFSTMWMSRIDAEKAKKELGFRHPPLREYLARIVDDFLAHPRSTPPENYALRPRELELARRG